MKIEIAEVREVLDSRGTPTIEVTLGTAQHVTTASVPSGKSTGSKEALEKRDPDGRGVSEVCRLLREEVFPALVVREFSDQRALDTFLIELDGTPNKARLGANGILAVSIAYAKLSAKNADRDLWRHIAEQQGFTPSYPRLYMNVMNGGAHADFRLPFQEYIVVVGGVPSEAYKRAQEIFTTLGNILRTIGGTLPMGDEGGYSPQFGTLERPFEILSELIHNKDEIFLAIDAAATEFFENGSYHLLGTAHIRAELAQTYRALVEKFGLKSIEDPFSEDDSEGFALLCAEEGNSIIVVGDDLTVTNPRILKEMVAARAGNALIIKPNQIGTLTEVYDTVRIAHGAGWKTIVSHRSGETEDSFIADLAVGVGAYGLKAGAPSQRVRAVKYERLIAIERELQER